MNIQRGILPDADPVLRFDVEGVGRLDAEGVVGDIQTTVIGDVLAKRKAALADADNVVVGILLIGRDVHREQKVVVFLGTTAEKFLTCVDSVKLSDVGLDRGSTFRIQSRGVHHHTVEISDLPGDASLFVLLCGDVFDQSSESLNILVADFCHGSPHRVLKRLGGSSRPMTGRVFGEVVSRTRSGVHVGVIDSGGLGRLVAAG